MDKNNKVVWLNGNGVRSAKGGLDFGYDVIMKNIDVRISTSIENTLVRINMNTEDLLLMKEAIERELKEESESH